MSKKQQIKECQARIVWLSDRRFKYSGEKHVWAHQKLDAEIAAAKAKLKSLLSTPREKEIEAAVLKTINAEQQKRNSFVNVSRAQLRRRVRAARWMFSQMKPI